MANKLNLSRRRKKLRRRRITVITLSIILLLGIGVGAAYLTDHFLNKPSGDSKNIFGNIQEKIASGKNRSEGKEDNKVTAKPEKPVVKEPLPTDVNKGSNTSIEGDKYTFSAFDSQKANEHKLPADGKKIVFLTFDDGPSVNNTPVILDTLKKHDVKATFFVWTKNLDGNQEVREILKRELEEGHAIGNHSYSHDYKKLYPGRTANLNSIMSDFDLSNNKLKETLGPDFETKVIRFPGGAMSWKNMQPAKDAFAAKGIAFADWNIDSTDAKSNNRTKEQLINEIKKELEGLEAAKVEKITLLMHDAPSKKSTAEALPEIITHFKTKGYEFRTLK